MKLKDLMKKMPDTGDNLIEKEVEWQGEKFTCFVKAKLSYGNRERIQRAIVNQDASINARMVSEAVTLGDNGEEKLRYEVVDGMDFDLVIALRKAYDEVHGVVDDEDEPAQDDKAKKT